MANTYTVVNGDTLSEIAEKYLGDASAYKQLAAINNIQNPDLIYVGQEIQLDNSGGSSSSSSGSTNSNTAEIIQFGLQSGTDNTLFAVWTWVHGSDNTTDCYAVKWEYKAGGIWFVGNSSSNTVDYKDPGASRQSTYSIPDNATSVRFKVRPISKKYTKNEKETSYWSASWSTLKTYNVSDLPPKQPSAPTVEVKNLKLTASLDNLDVNATGIQFQVVKDDTTVFKTGTANINTGSATYSCSVTAGSKYKVRCRSFRDEMYSDWSEYSNNYNTAPAASKGITICRATSETSIYLEWNAVDTADSYELEYTTKKQYFDGSDQTTTESGIKFTHYEKTGLESGQEYFFRVRAVNDSGESAWSDIKSIVIGKEPESPTTWSSTTTAITGEPLKLYWMHNAEDESIETSAELELYVNDVYEAHIITSTKTEETKDEASVYSIDTSKYIEGTKLKWRVRTAGITKKYGEWSIQRTVDIYAPATLELRITNVADELVETLKSFPFHVSAVYGPNTQTPTSYHLVITANEAYETVDSVGNVKMVSVGDQVYSKHFDISTNLETDISAGDVDLENNVKYTVTCTVSMNSGLTAEATSTFIVGWEESISVPNAEVGIDTETLVAHIRPYCEFVESAYYEVIYNRGEYVKTDNKLDGVWGTVINDATTTTGEQVYYGTTSDGDELYYCYIESSKMLEDVVLSVYRREFDGTFTELATNIDNMTNTYITDPHPSLDFARYRIVAMSKTTGAVSYNDLPGVPVGEISVIIQWDDAWTYFDSTVDDALEQPTWSGSMLKLPYNIDVSDSNRPDVALVEYIGRSHPVSYYGTQQGSTSTWNVEIPKSDKETLYSLRRLATWMGDVYVREPSGSGYWANITVSFNQKHLKVTIPVTLDITRVAGGM